MLPTSSLDVHVQPINYPTVPHGTEHLHLTPSPLHSDIDHLIDALAAVWCDVEMRQAA